MAVNINTAVSGLLQEGVSYTVRYRYVTASGRGPAWEYAVISTESVLPGSTGLTVEGGAGQSTITWQNPQDLRFKASDTWRGASTDFGAAMKIGDGLAGGGGQVQSITDTVAAGTWYYWNMATGGASLEADPQGPVAGVVT